MLPYELKTGLNIRKEKVAEDEEAVADVDRGSADWAPINLRLD